MNDRTFTVILIMSMVLAICIVLQHATIFKLGYELSQLKKDKQNLEEIIQRQNLVSEELSSPAVLRQQQKRFNINLSSKVDWPSESDIILMEKVAIE